MKNAKIFIPVSIGFIAVLLVLAFGTIDYNVSVNLVNRDSIWAEFFNMFGEAPFLVGLLAFVAALYGGRKRSNKILNIVYSILTFPFLLLFTFGLVQAPFRYRYEFVESGIPQNMQTLTYVLTLILFAGVVYAVFKIKPETFRKYRRAAGIVALLVVTEIILVNVLKSIWARPRMRSMESFEQFKYWWQINGPAAITEEELKSFPSGHTANAFVMVAFLSFLDRNKTKLYRNFAIFALAWGVLTGISRVVLGAHFLSDVVFSGYLTVMLYFLFEKLINKNKTK
ncbi:MAG: phosphatase PAP2 family protein [Chloroflexota bacterium]